LGNKRDLNDLREVSEDEGRVLAEETKIPFYEVSAKEDVNVSEAIENLVKKIVSLNLN
jgi:hypothetical protein